MEKKCNLMSKRKHGDFPEIEDAESSKRQRETDVWTHVGNMDELAISIWLIKNRAPSSDQKEFKINWKIIPDPDPQLDEHQWAQLLWNSIDNSMESIVDLLLTKHKFVLTMPLPTIESEMSFLELAVQQQFRFKYRPKSMNIIKNILSRCDRGAVQTLLSDKTKTSFFMKFAEEYDILSLLLEWGLPADSLLSSGHTRLVDVCEFWNPPPPKNHGPSRGNHHLALKAWGKPQPCPLSSDR